MEIKWERDKWTITDLETGRVIAEAAHLVCRKPVEFVLIDNGYGGRAVTSGTLITRGNTLFIE